MKINFFWIWTALNPSFDNTYFLIEDWENKLQVDAWWGLWLAQKVKSKDAYFENIFITHSHSDHILWIIHLFRTITKEIPKLNIFCSKKVEKDIRTIAKITIKKQINDMFDNWIINFINIDNLEEQKIWEFLLQPINLYSEKMEQYWFLLKYKDKKILFFWDEAYWVFKRNDLERFKWIDYLICEAMIPEKMSLKWWWKIDIDKMHHITSQQAWNISSYLESKNLILVHTKEIKDREKELLEDARKKYNGKIIIPNDWYILYI